MLKLKSKFHLRGSILLVAAVFGLAVAAISHIEQPPSIFITKEAQALSTTTASSWSDLMNALLLPSPVIIELTSDIYTPASFTIPSGANITLAGSYDLIATGDFPVVAVNGANTAFTLDGPGLTRNSPPWGNFDRGVLVTNGAEFTMRSGEIHGHNLGLGERGGGVSIDQGSTFTMYGGKIHNNRSENGGGVYIGQGSSFTMRGGEIHDNMVHWGSGGGVLVDGSSFTMYGGEVHSNEPGGISIIGSTFTLHGGKIHNNTSTGWLGGVSISWGSAFTMHGGEIHDNFAQWSGAGVVVSESTFTMYDGRIHSNTAANGAGGGVYAADSIFTMRGGKVYNNTASVGGGVHVEWGTFAMYDGEIYSNTVVWHGGGVYIEEDGTFTMYGGEIHSNTAGGGGGGVYITERSAFTMHTGSIHSNTANETGGGVHVGHITTFTMHGGSIHNNTTNESGGGIFIDTLSNLTISPSAIFHGNIALDGATNYGLAQGLIDYPNIRWHSFASGNNSIIGTHLLNNYDINFHGSPITYHTVTFMDDTEIFTTQNVLDGAPTVPPANPTRPDHLFTHWSSVAPNGSPWNFSTPIIGNIVLFAGWIEAPGVPDTGFAPNANSAHLSTAIPTTLATLLSLVGIATIIKLKRKST